MGGQITIKDIARELKVSPSTVSRALKNHPDISKETIKSVNELAKKLNYQPNTIALSLRKSKTFTIGVIIPQIVHYFFSNVISGIEDVAYNAGYNVIICQSDENLEREITDARTLVAHRVDGLLISKSRETVNFDHFQEIYDREIPMVFFDRVIEELPTSRVIVDDYEGSFQATEHLIEMGYKNIVHLAGPEKLTITRDRINGYVDAMKKHNLDVNDWLIHIHGDSDHEEGRAILETLLSRDVKPDAVFAVNDLVALGAMKAVKAHGLHIPRDFGIVGFSNWLLASLVEPTLSTVNQPGYAMGKEAARLFIDQVDHKDTFEPVTKTLKTELIIRDSSRRKDFI